MDNNLAEYNQLLFDFFIRFANERYGLVYPRSEIITDFSELLDGKVSSLYEALRWMKLNLTQRELFTLPWKLVLNDTEFEKRVEVVADFAPSKIEEDKFDLSSVVVDISIIPYRVEKLITVTQIKDNKQIVTIVDDKT